MARTANGTETGISRKSGSSKLIYAILGIIALALIAAAATQFDTKTTSYAAQETGIKQPASNDGSPLGSGDSGSNQNAVNPVTKESNDSAKSTNSAVPSKKYGKTGAAPENTAAPAKSTATATKTSNVAESGAIVGKTYQGDIATKSVTINGLPAKQISQTAVNWDKFEDNTAYVTYGEFPRNDGPTTCGYSIYFEVSREKLQDISILLNGKVVIDNFQTGAPDENQPLRYNSYWPVFNGGTDVSVAASNGGGWNWIADFKPLNFKDAKQEMTQFEASQSISGEYYRVIASVTYYQ